LLIGIAPSDLDPDLSGTGSAPEKAGFVPGMRTRRKAGVFDGMRAFG
jgi:hypothetical protein